MSKKETYDDYIENPNTQISGRYISSRLYNFRAKKKALVDYLEYFFARTMTMFKWTGLPANIPQEDLERILQTCGHCVMFKLGEKLYISNGYLGGIQNEFYIPKEYIVSNPYIPELGRGESHNLTIGEDCVMIKNDFWYKGLQSLNRKYATLLLENDITLRMVDINARTAFIMTANDGNTADSANEFYRQLEDGNPCIIKKSGKVNVNGQPEIDIVPTVSVSSKFSTSVNEHHQYILALWWQELGVNANYNMKRETLTASEVGINDNQLLPLIECMLICRKRAAEEMNEMFGTNISVELSGVWRNIREEADMKRDADEANVNAVETETEKVEAEIEQIEAQVEMTRNLDEEVNENAELSDNNEGNIVLDGEQTISENDERESSDTDKSSDT